MTYNPTDTNNKVSVLKNPILFLTLILIIALQNATTIQGFQTTSTTRATTTTSIFVSSLSDKVRTRGTRGTKNSLFVFPMWKKATAASTPTTTTIPMRSSLNDSNESSSPVSAAAAGAEAIPSSPDSNVNVNNNKGGSKNNNNNNNMKNEDTDVTDKDDETKIKVKTYNPLRLAVLRLGLTEPAWTSPLNYLGKKERGEFVCAYCGHTLFDYNAKYDSRSGWPSFWRSVNDGAVSYRMEYDGRLECQCGNCKSHLGHVFLDGPKPSDVDQQLLKDSPESDPRSRRKGGSTSSSTARLPRFCINGASLRWNKKTTVQDGEEMKEDYSS